MAKISYHIVHTYIGHVKSKFKKYKLVTNLSKKTVDSCITGKAAADCFFLRKKVSFSNNNDIVTKCYESLFVVQVFSDFSCVSWNNILLVGLQ